VPISDSLFAAGFVAAFDLRTGLPGYRAPKRKVQPEACNLKPDAFNRKEDTCQKTTPR
jgi:hypothetical protein